MKKHLLILLIVAILLPSFAALFVAGTGIVQHRRAMEKVAESYVKDVAQSIATQIEFEWSTGIGMGKFQSMAKFYWLAFNVSIPGWLAIVDSEGRILVSTEGAEILPSLWNKEIPLGEALELKSPKGKLFTLAAYPAGSTGWFVVAAVSWDELMGPMIKFNKWPLLVAIIGLLGLVSVYALWKWLVAPLRKLSQEVSALRWGVDLPEKDDPVAVFEVVRLRNVIYHLAQSAIDRANLMKRYVSDIVKVQEEEKRRLAREIHDGPLQEVTALMQQIRLARMELEDGKESTSRLRMAEEGGQLAVRDLRSLCDELSPPWLDLGLKEVLEELGERISKHLGLEVSVEVESGIFLPQDVCLALFRVAQEALYNSYRHGGATEVKVRVYRSDDNIVLEISDNGKGFDPNVDVETLRLSGHRGLANMSERMSLIGGSFNVYSQEGHGTTILCKVPVTCASA